VKRKRDQRDEETSQAAQGAGAGPSAKQPRRDPPALGTLTRQPSVLEVRTHDGLPKVRLHPRIVVSDIAVNRLIVSRLTRPPSPFGNRMGDHTVAWQAVVDSVHALVHGRPVSEALTTLAGRQGEVQAWMSDPSSPGRGLLSLLNDRGTRKLLLENSAAQVAAQLDRANRVTTFSGAVKRLELAIAWHLAYLNYLPFATVPAKSARGSSGSDEGEHRQVILLEETKGMTSPVPAIDDENARESIRYALWGLFSFEAAIREAQAELALRPSLASSTGEASQKLGGLAAACIGWADWFLSGPIVGTGKRSQARKLAAAQGRPVRQSARPAKKLDDIVTDAAVYSGRTEEYPQIAGLAGLIRDAAQYIGDVRSGRRTAKVHDEVDRYKTKMGAALSDAAVLNADLTAQSATAAQDAALILACLLHDHQATVARAYPRAVVASGFFDPSPLEASVARLEAELADLIDDQAAGVVKGSAGGAGEGSAAGAGEGSADSAGQGSAAGAGEGSAAGAGQQQAGETREVLAANLQELLAQVRTVYATLGTPAVASTNGWVEYSATEAMTVTYRRGGPLLVDGRPAAPAGVAGMGSHTTAWVVETLAADALVSGARDEQGALRALRDQVASDLAGKVITLDRLLPAAQLAAGQMNVLFEAAYQVYQAKTVEDAAASYLRFRNLLPYATVDAGTRTGTGERMSGSADETFDLGSLRAAAELQSTRLTEEVRIVFRDADQIEGQSGPEEGTSRHGAAEREVPEGESGQDDDRPETGREIAVRILAQAASRLTEEGDANWGTIGVIRDAVAASAARLRNWSRTLDSAVPDQEEIYDTVVGVRKDEHLTVYATSRASRLLTEEEAEGGTGTADAMTT
jgi:hypothetical protein